MLKRLLSFTIFLLFLLGAASLRAYEFSIQEIMDNPTVACERPFGFDVPLVIWERLLENPYIMGKLWEIYLFSPYYRVVKTAGGMHISDPSGIEGDIRQVGKSDGHVTFYGTGTFDHWAVPSFFTASGVVIFEYKEASEGFCGNVNIFMRGDNLISRFVMKLFAGSISSRIGNRMGSTLKNVEKMMADIANNPKGLREKLPDDLLNYFDKTFPLTLKDSTDR